MDTGKPMRRASPRLALFKLILSTTLLALSAFAAAVDNPDAPDYIGEFRARSASYEQAVGEAAGGNASTELGAWFAFLERELTQTQAALSAALSEPERAQLKRAQSRWRKQFEADEDLFRAIWSRERAGSSAALSVGLERAAALQQRVELLLRMRGAMAADGEP